MSNTVESQEIIHGQVRSLSICQGLFRENGRRMSAVFESKRKQHETVAGKRSN